MGLIVVRIYSCTERFRAVLMKLMLIVPLSSAVFEEVLGHVGAAIDLRDVLDRFILDF